MPNRDIQRMFEPLRITEQFLLKSNLREVLFRKPPRRLLRPSRRLADDGLRPHRRAASARAVGPRVGGPRSGAANPRTRSRAPVRSRHPSADGRSSACSGISRARSSTAARAWTTSCLGLASEELEYVDTSLRVIMSVHVGLNCLTLLSWGTEDQKQRYLVPQAQGTKIATYGLTEPSAGSDARGIQTVAIKKGDRYVLTGEKMWISLADVADNYLVFAWSDLEKKKQRDPVGHERVHRRACVQGILERHADARSGASWPATPGSSRWRTSRCRRRTWSAAKARASRSRCSRSTRAATPWRPARRA